MESLKEQFKEYDIDDNGFISKSDLKNKYKHLGDKDEFKE